MVTVIYLERRALQNLMLGVIIRKLSERQFLKPIILSEITVTSQVVFKSLVLSFCLSIGLRMERRT